MWSRLRDGDAGCREQRGGKGENSQNARARRDLPANRVCDPAGISDPTGNFAACGSCLAGYVALTGWYFILFVMSSYRREAMASTVLSSPPENATAQEPERRSQSKSASRLAASAGERSITSDMSQSAGTKERKMSSAAAVAMCF